MYAFAPIRRQESRAFTSRDYRGQSVRCSRPSGTGRGTERDWSDRYLQVVYVWILTGKRLRNHCVRVRRQVADGSPEASPSERRALSQTSFHQVVRRVLAHYEGQTEEEAITEDEVRELIARRIDRRTDSWRARYREQGTYRLV